MTWEEPKPKWVRVPGPLT